MVPIAWFISPHGFGHAARTCAVLEALQQLVPAACHHLYTTVPAWFLAESLTAPYAYHACETDIGMVQTSPLHEDVAATVARLGSFIPFDAARVGALAADVRQTGARTVVCDIAPLGIAVAHAAGLPSILIENFTWDWIYEGYGAADARMTAFADYLKDIFTRATLRIQAEPVCQRAPGAITVPPISRAPRTPPAATRRALQVADGAPLALLTMGGVAQAGLPAAAARHAAGMTVVIPNNVAAVQRQENVILLPWHSAYFHPDLVCAADVVIGKLGYSTVAEVYASGGAMGWLPRPHFRESAAMAAFVRANISQVDLYEEALADGSWTEAVQPLLAAPRQPRTAPGGAACAAALIGDFLAGAAAPVQI